MPLLDQPDKTMLVVAPHADDEVLGAGGLLLRAAAAGWQTHALYMTVSGFDSPASGARSTLQEREREVAAAATALRLQSRDALFRGEQFHLRLDTVAQAELIGFVERAVARLRPSVVLMPCAGHYHQDHRATATACLAALRPAPGGARHFVATVLAYGHAAAGYGGAALAFSPDVFVDIGDVIEDKLAALACYRSQLCEPPHPRSLDAVRSAAAACGACSGSRYAEAYECIRLVV